MNKMVEALRFIASYTGDDIMELRNMAARALSTLEREEDRFRPVLLVSSSMFMIREYKRRYPEQECIVAMDTEHARGIDTRTPCGIGRAC